MFGAVVFQGITWALIFSYIDTEHYEVQARFVESITRIDSDHLNAMAFNVPFLNLIATSKGVETTFDNTGIPIKYLHRFLNRSNAVTTSSRRDWHTAELPQFQYDRIRDYLWERKMITEEAAGNESYKWIGQAKNNLMVFYLKSTIPNLGVQAVYAQETDNEELPHSK